MECAGPRGDALRYKDGKEFSGRQNGNPNPWGGGGGKLKCLWLLKILNGGRVVDGG